MDHSFPPIGQMQRHHSGESSFWPSFTDIMMVITMIFLMATSLLVVRNWQLVAELQESIEAEQLATQIIETTSLENATLEERLANAEQSNSILRLRLLKKDEELRLANEAINQQERQFTKLEIENLDLRESLERANAEIAIANLELDAASAQYQELSQQLALAEQQLAQQKIAAEQRNSQLEQQLATAQGEIQQLSDSTQQQQQSIDDLTRDKRLLASEIESYNQQILALQSEYQDVKTKYEELIKPARSAQGKYIAEVYYVKRDSVEIIRYKEPGYDDFVDLSLAEVEKQLSKLKDEKGNDLYVKIIIPTESGLTYNEAWTFMRSLLAKYDYYYQD